MNESQIQILISDARGLQKIGLYEEAIQVLISSLPSASPTLEFVEIYKLLCYNYRKLEDFDLALYNINQAINMTQKCRSKDNVDDANIQLAICLMNKGIVFESRNEPKKALELYDEAIKLFKKLTTPKKIDNGIIINALLTAGTAHLNYNNKLKARNLLHEALKYFDDTKEMDRRYHAIRNTLKEIDSDGFIYGTK